MFVGHAARKQIEVAFLGARSAETILIVFSWCTQRRILVFTGAIRLDLIEIPFPICRPGINNNIPGSLPDPSP